MARRLNKYAERQKRQALRATAEGGAFEGGRKRRNMLESVRERNRK